MTKKKVLGVSGGQPITQADIERMADEAERGYGDAQLRHAGPGRPALGDGPARAVQARLDPQLHAALEQRTEADHKTPSAPPVHDPPDVVSAIDVPVSVVFETDNAARASQSEPRRPRRQRT